MKKFKTLFGTVSLFALFVLLSLACASTKIPTLPQSYEEIVEIPGTKDELYTKANLVFVDIFNSAESVIQFSDKEAGVVKGKYVYDTRLPLKDYVIYTIVEVSVKDGKYRITMTLADVIEKKEFWTGKPMSVTPTDEILAEAGTEWRSLAASFKNRMNKDSSW